MDLRIDVDLRIVGARNSSQIFHMDGREPSTLASRAVPSRKLEVKAEPGLEPRSAGMGGRYPKRPLNHFTKNAFLKSVFMY